MKSGIYKIVNTKNSKMYIGSAKELNRRKKTHFTQLAKGEHHNVHLQRAWNVYGEDSFEFHVIEYTENLIEREQYWINFYGFETLYNICPKAYSNQGKKLSTETREKISKALKGRIKSEEERLKLSAANTGKKHSEETKQRLREINLGKTYSDEIKEKHRKICIENNYAQYLPRKKKKGEV